MRQRMLLGLMAVLAMALVVSASPPAVVDSGLNIMKTMDLVAGSTTPATGSVPDIDTAAFMENTSRDPDVGANALTSIYATNERRNGDARLIFKGKVAASAHRASRAVGTVNSAARNANALRVCRT